MRTAEGGECQAKKTVGAKALRLSVFDEQWRPGWLEQSDGGRVEEMRAGRRWSNLPSK